jgi:osmotically-inducible protein OsmY
VSACRFALSLAVAAGLTASLSGCPLAIVGGLGAAGGVGYAANQERGVGGTASDFSIKTNIQTALAKADPQMAAHVDVTVYEGRALLTGTTPDPQLKAQAGGIAQGIPGVRAVYDEIEVAPTETVWNSTKDAWITSEVKSGLVFSDVRSVNYDIETSDGSVYLIGSARSQAELDHATGIARDVRGVRRVVSYVEIRPGEPPGPQQAQSPPGPPMESAPPPGAAFAPAPTTPVEVQKLGAPS